MNEMANAYRSAAVVALPLHENMHASGATVVIETLSAGSALVLSNVGGIHEYVSGADVSLVDAGDSDSFAARVHDHLRISSMNVVVNRERFIANGLTQSDYVRRYEAITLWLLKEADWIPAIEEFAPLPEVTRSK